MSETEKTERKPRAAADTRRRCRVVLPAYVTLPQCGSFTNLGFSDNDPAFYDPATGLVEGTIRGHAVGVHVAQCQGIYFFK